MHGQSHRGTSSRHPHREMSAGGKYAPEHGIEALSPGIHIGVEGFAPFRSTPGNAGGTAVEGSGRRVPSETHSLRTPQAGCGMYALSGRVTAR